jgi:hypothetical protein
MKHLDALKLFAVFLLFGLVVSLGIRAARRGPEEAAKTPETAPAPDSHAGHAPPKHGPEHGSGEEAGPLLVDLGNTICPINEGEVDGSTYVEWNHLRVGFCCPGCDRKFLAAPEASLEKAGIAWEEIAAAIEAYMNAPADQKEKRLEELRRKADIIREP